MAIGRALILAGLVLVAAGLLLTFVGRLPFNLGRLPGDILVRKKGATFYFPLATCVILSLVASLLLWLFRR